jgi:hypothetical protein
MNIVEGWKTIQASYWKHVATDLQRANHDVRMSDRHFSRLIDEAKKAGNHEVVESLESEWSADLDGDRAEVDRLISRYWQRRGARFRIPLPSYDEGEYWENSRYDNRTNLTTKGIDHVEIRIYEKRKKKWEFWFALAPTLIGVIGGLTGLAAVLTHLGK